MSTFFKNSGSKGSDYEKISKHRYFTRSCARKYKEPIVQLTPLKYIDNGCGDIYVELQQDKLCEKLESLKEVPLIKKSMDPPSTIAKTFRVLKFVVFIGMTGLLIASMLENFVVQNGTYNDIKDDLNHVKKKVGDLDEKINKLIENGTNSILNNIKELFGDQNRIINNIPSLDYIKNLLKDALSQYDADKTGRTDFALESSGGAIISIRNTENYVRGSPTLTLFGVPLCSASNSPRTIIQPSTLPGECWAFKGSSGAAIIKLLGKVIVTGVSLEHIPASISPTGELKTAPKEFSIWGLTSEVDNEGLFLGQFIYNISGPTVQYFPINNCCKAYNYVEFKIISNHGNPEYTCVYRIRVHGKMNGPRM